MFRPLQGYHQLGHIQRLTNTHILKIFVNFHKQFRTVNLNMNYLTEFTVLVCLCI